MGVATSRSPEAARTLLACLQASGRKVGEHLHTLVSLSESITSTVSETEWACARWLLPDSASSISAASPMLGYVSNASSESTSSDSGIPGYRRRITEASMPGHLSTMSTRSPFQW